MTKFDFENYTNFVANYSIINGELIDEFNANLSPQRLKKEMNNMYNIVNLLNGNDILFWNPVERYIVGELTQNATADNKFYRARKISENKRPDLFPEFWEEANSSDYTRIGDFSNYLSKDNEEAYFPSTQYNPATKGYIDFGLGNKLNIDGKAQDSSLLNGESVANTLGNSITKPASQKLVQTLDNKVNTKLDSSEFNSTNIMNMVQNVDGAGTGLDADLLDGQSSEYFMKVGENTNFNTMKTPGTYFMGVGSIGAPSTTETFVVVVSGSGNNNYFSQIATSVTENKLYYRSFVGNWTSWKEFANATGSVATADKLSSPVTIKLIGDASGVTSFDGSQNVSINVMVLDDSHIHDTRYYTKTEQDNNFLPLHAKADDSHLLNGAIEDINDTAGTIVKRDANGDINSTASTAKYADLAEKYTYKEIYPVGTIVKISTSEEYDIEENDSIDNIFGVISDKPGFILDNGIDGLPVAMIGKTPVLLSGKINKGDKITAYNNYAVKAKPGDTIIGISLQNKMSDEINLIRCVVKINL